MSAYFEIVQTDAGPHLRVAGGNDEPVANTEVYSSERNAFHAIDVIAEAVDAWRAGESIRFSDERSGS